MSSYLIFLLILVPIAGFLQSTVYHKWATHGSIRFTSKYWEYLIVVATALATGPTFLDRRVYRVVHLKHHDDVDTVNDVHSPSNLTWVSWIEQRTNRSLGPFHYCIDFLEMLWLTKIACQKAARGIRQYERTGTVDASLGIDIKFFRKLPTITAFERMTLYSQFAWPIRIFWVVFYAAFCICSGTHMLLWWLVIPNSGLVPSQGTTINLFGHDRSKDGSDKSTNLFASGSSLLGSIINWLWLLYFTSGEWLHKYHHEIDWDPNFGWGPEHPNRQWWEIDLGYWVLVIWEKLGIIKFTRKEIVAEAAKRQAAKHEAVQA